MSRFSRSVAVLLASTSLFALGACMHDTRPSNNAMQEDQIVRPMAKADSDMQRVLDAQASLHPKPIAMLSPVEARRQPSPSDGVRLVMRQQGMNPADDMAVDTRNIIINGETGPLKARIYMPKNASNDQALPVVVYYHGGGWVIADLDTYDASPRVIAKQVNAIVVSVEYRHAPENKFPAAHDDAFAAYKWVLDHANSFGGDPQRVAVMGESAGGNLAINVAIEARDMHVPMPVYEVLVYPVAGVNMNTVSYQENEFAKPLNKAMMGWFFRNAISNDADKIDPRLDLVGKADLHGLPPTTIITAQIDPLRSEGKMLAKKLENAGVLVSSENYNGVTHEFFGMGAVVSKAKDAEDKVSDDLKTAFSDM